MTDDVDTCLIRCATAGKVLGHGGSYSLPGDSNYGHQVTLSGTSSVSNDCPIVSFAIPRASTIGINIT